MIRCGIGYDVHPLKEGRPCFLGGVLIDHPRGPDGHSDADVLLHAIADALLGALGEGDIGQHYPNTDVRWKNTPSLFFLHDIRIKITAHKASIINIDATVIAEEPKIHPYISEMRKKISTALSINPDQVNIKATTNENLGFIGRREGLAALAIATLDIES